MHLSLLGRVKRSNLWRIETKSSQTMPLKILAFLCAIIFLFSIFRKSKVCKFFVIWRAIIIYIFPHKLAIFHRLDRWFSLYFGLYCYTFFLLSHVLIVTLFCILNPRNSRVMYPSSLWNVCLQTYRNNRIC